MRRLLCLFVVLMYAVALADNTIVVRRAAASSGTGNLLSETFNASGYDLAWTETPSGETTIVDEDETAGCPAATGWSGQCNQFTVPAFTEGNAVRDMEATHTFTYSRFYVRWTAESMADTNASGLFGVGATTATPTTCDPYCVELYQTGTDLRLRLLVGGVGVDSYPAASGLTLPVNIRVEVYFNNNGASDSIEWRVDGGTEYTNTGALSAVDVQRVILGSGIEYANTFYIDSVAVGDSGWIADN